VSWDYQGGRIEKGRRLPNFLFCDILTEEEINCMEKKRKINRWDRRRSKRRLRKLKESEKYKKIESSLDTVNIKLPELTDKQKAGIKSDLLKGTKRRREA
jgi:predicted DNA binding protein